VQVTMPTDLAFTIMVFSLLQVVVNLILMGINIKLLIDALRDRKRNARVVEDLAVRLKDPVAVRVAMQRGEIAKPRGYEG
jgi:hypothetical protein